MRKTLQFVIWAKKHGLTNAIYRLSYQKDSKFEYVGESSVGNTSITDSELLYNYSFFCEHVVKFPEAFQNFRSATVMIQALDHVSIDHGNAYISEILEQNKWSNEWTDTIERIDSIGKPRKFKFRPYGTFSPTLLRYLKTYTDLKYLFGPLKNLNVAEIGVGFGGQASLISLIDKPMSYSFYDIPPVLDLVKEFTTALSIPGSFKFHDGRAPIQTNPDLVISNYAFSEIEKTVQDQYLEKVILPSRFGYITWNTLSHDLLQGYSLADLIRIIPNAQILPEKPYTSDGNAIIVWGMKENNISANKI